MSNTTTTTTKTVRLTKRNYFEAISDMVAGRENAYGITAEQVVEFCKHEMALLANKGKSASGEKKLTATQKANEEYKVMIREFLDGHEPVSCSGIIKGIPEFTEMAFTPSKVNALLRQLKDAGEVVRTEDKKGTALFSLVTIG